MTECDDDRARREMPVLDGAGAPTPDPDGAFLLEDPSDQPPELTARGESDVHAAIVEGLASYVARLEFAVAGRNIALSRVVTDWADHDDGPVPSPSAAVSSLEIGKYVDYAPAEVAVLAPSTVGRRTTLVCTATYELEQITVQAMCEDKIQRAGVRRMLEDAFAPVVWMRGFRLVLPRYHNAVCSYSLVSGQQPDTQEMAAAGLRPLTMTLKATCCVYRVQDLPLAHPVLAGTIVGKRRI